MAPHSETPASMTTNVPSNENTHVPTPPSAEKPKIMLIPFDPESEEQCERLRSHRVACGWKADKIPKWRVLQREGKMSLHWAVLDPSDTRKGAWLAKHLARYPDESTPIHDTAKSIGGRPRDATSARASEPFIPLGEISIDTIASTPVQTPLLADPPAGRFHISAFYVSRALHGSGIGGVTMAAAEDMAVKVLGAKVLTLDTLDKRALMTEEEGGLPGALAAMKRLQDNVTPKFSTQVWYERMGYRIIRSLAEFDPKSSYVIKGGDPYEEYCLPSVWMEKVLV